MEKANLLHLAFSIKSSTSCCGERHLSPSIRERDGMFRLPHDTGRGTCTTRADPIKWVQGG